MTATIQKIFKPTKYRAVDTSTSTQETIEMVKDGTFSEDVSEDATGSTFGWSCGTHWSITGNKAILADDTGSEGNLFQSGGKVGDIIYQHGIIVITGISSSLSGAVYGSSLYGAVTYGSGDATGLPDIITGNNITQATATCTVSGGVVNTVTITNAGSGYTTNPKVTVSGGGATEDASISANIEKTNYIFYGQ